MLFICLFLLLVVPAAEASLRTARQARQMLGPAIWSRVLRIENANPQSQYPAVVYATVFEFDSLLWFYTDTNGTQSLSRQLGRLEEDKAELQPLLQRIDPGFADYEILPEEGVQFAGAPQRLLNGCFIESVAALRAAFDAGVPMREAALLTYYIDHDGRRFGHTVLVYTTGEGTFVIDRGRRRTPRPLEIAGLHADAMEVARAAQGNYLAEEIVRARWVAAVIPATLLAPAYAGDRVAERVDPGVG